MVMATLGEVFDQAVSTARTAAYFDALADYQIEALEGGARALIRSARWMPKPVDLAEAAQTWAREEETRRREQFVRERGLARDAEMSEAQAAAMQSKVREMLAGLKQRLGWA